MSESETRKKLDIYAKEAGKSVGNIVGMFLSLVSMLKEFDKRLTALEVTRQSEVKGG